MSIRTPITADLVRGALDLEVTTRGVLPHRLPARARAQCPDPQLLGAQSQPSGVRLLFRTHATTIELEALPSTRVYLGAPPRPEGVYDLVVDGALAGQGSISGGNTLTIDLATGSAENVAGEPGLLRFPEVLGGSKIVEIWLPHNESTELVSLRTDAPIEPIPGTGRRVWLHHGSSISQGSNARHPTGIWPAVAAMIGGVDLINTGFGGSALLDQFTARALRDTPADLISVKIGINIVNTDVMRLRAFTSAVHGFLDTIRDGHPTTPLVVISPIYCPIHEGTPGPGAFDPAGLLSGRITFRATGDPAEVASGKLTLRVIRDELDRIVAQRTTEDPNIDLVDGLTLYGPPDFDDVLLPDNLHPDADTHLRIGQRFAESVFGTGGRFA